MDPNNMQPENIAAPGTPFPDPAQAAPAGNQPAPAAAPQYQHNFDPYTGQPVNPYAGQTANPYQAQTPPYQPPKPRRRSGTARETVAAILLAVLSFITVDCILWADTLGAGFAAGAVLLMAAALWYLFPVRRRTGFYTVSCILLFFAGSVSLVFSADTGIKALTLLVLMILYACVLMDGMKLRMWTPGTFPSVGDFFYTAFALSFGKIVPGLYGLFHREKSTSDRSKAGFGKAMLGLLIALPVAAILAALLSSADQAFHGMLDGIDLGSFPEKLLSAFLAIPLFVLLFCQLFSLQDIRREQRQESDKGIDPIILTFFLIGISVVYVAYLFSQLAYFFSGFMGFLPEEFTYAEYARRGFFELSAVSVINIVIVILGTALSRKKNGRLPLGVKLPSLFLCLFSLVLIGTEVAKMKMYMDTYGLTRLRILTTLFMIFLAVVFLALMIYLFARRFPYLKVAVVCGAALVIAVNFVSVDRMVAEYNVWAYQNSVLETVDVDTITELGDAAVPALLKLAQDDDEKVAKEAQSDLYYRWKLLHEYGDMFEYRIGDLKSYDWRGFNSVSYEARQLLLEKESLFSQTSVKS